jgi:hypothetical protein
MSSTVKILGLYHEAFPARYGNSFFYSDDEVIAHPYKFPGRYRRYGLEIDSMLLNGGKTAVVGYADTAFNEYEYPEAPVFGSLFIYTTPTKDRLRKRFEFKEGDIFEPYK